jgi:molecular chaperone GrpE
MQDREDQVLRAAQPDATSEALFTPNEILLKDRLAIADARLFEMQDAFLRAKAEGENIRRRSAEEIAKARKFSIENFAEAMVPVRDSLEMALNAETPSIDSLKEGVDLTLKQLISAFEKNHLMEILPTRGDKLDPMKHQAVATLPSEQESNTVISVLQKGYMIADRLLRPAIVTATEAK